MSLDSTHALCPRKLWHHAPMTSPGDKEEDFPFVFSQLHWNVNNPCWSTGRPWSISGRGLQLTAHSTVDRGVCTTHFPCASLGYWEATPTGISNVHIWLWTLAAGRHQTKSQNDFSFFFKDTLFSLIPKNPNVPRKLAVKQLNQFSWK